MTNSKSLKQREAKNLQEPNNCIILKSLRSKTFHDYGCGNHANVGVFLQVEKTRLRRLTSSSPARDHRQPSKTVAFIVSI